MLLLWFTLSGNIRIGILAPLSILLLLVKHERERGLHSGSFPSHLNHSIGGYDEAKKEVQQEGVYCCVCVSSCLNWNVSKGHADRMFMLPKSQSVSYHQYLPKNHKITISAPHSQTPVHFYSPFHSYPPFHLLSTFFSILPGALLLNFQTQSWKFISMFWSLLPPSMGLHEKLSTRSSRGTDSNVLCKHVFIFYPRNYFSMVITLVFTTSVTM